MGRARWHMGPVTRPSSWAQLRQFHLVQHPHQPRPDLLTFPSAAYRPNVILPVRGCPRAGPTSTRTSPTVGT